jgi:hypothetical protein
MDGDLLSLFVRIEWPRRQRYPPLCFLEPPLSGSFGLGEDAGGCDVGPCNRSIDVAFLCDAFGPARAGCHLSRHNVASEPYQVCGYSRWIGIAGGRPLRGGQCDEHAFVADPDLQGQVVGRYL